MKNIFILFHVGKRRGLSQDSQWRLLATDYYIRTSDSDSEVFFVGGGGLPISGAAQMKRFWQEENLIATKLHLCRNSNTSFSNINEIVSIISKYQNRQSMIITSNYHCKRVEDMICRNKMNCIEVLGAEDILTNSDKWCNSVKEYQTSLYVRKSYIKEAILRHAFFLETFFQYIRRILYNLK